MSWLDTVLNTIIANAKAHPWLPFVLLGFYGVHQYVKVLDNRFARVEAMLKNLAVLIEEQRGEKPHEPPY